MRSDVSQLGSEQCCGGIELLRESLTEQGSAVSVMWTARVARGRLKVSPELEGGL